MIKRLWQFPAVIGGTAVLTFCGVSALQASMNGPLHAFGAGVEAARASASASAAAQAIAAGTPVRREAGSDSPLAPSTIQAAGSLPSAVALAASAPLGGRAADDDGASDAGSGTDAGRGKSGARQAWPAPGQDGSAPNRPAQDLSDQGASLAVTGSGAAGVGADGQGSHGQGGPGQSGSAPGQGVRDAVSNPGLSLVGGSAGAAADVAAGQLSQEVNRWLRLADPPGLGLKVGQQNSGKKDQSPSGARKGQP